MRRVMASLAAPSPPPRRPLVRRLMLKDFRSYAALDLAIDERMVVFCGENGAGKTNLIEALSLLSPGRGLRRAELADCARVGGAGGFALSVEVEEDGERRQLGSAWSPAEDEGGLSSPTERSGAGEGDRPKGGGGGERKNRVDRAPVSSSRAFADYVRVVWLTPAMDSQFSGPASERRRFLDRFVLAIDPQHGARVLKFERALRGRNRLLEEGAARNRAWLEAIETEAAELGVAVAKARIECLTRLEALIATDRDLDSPFPWARLALEGAVERLVASGPAHAAQERYRAMLNDGRARDAAVGRTLIGPHLTDLSVWHGPKDAPAASASTGEQKALLVGLVLAHARLVAEVSGIAPLALLDEIAAHFDPRRRAALFHALERLGGQAFLTGADWATFADLKGRAQMFEVSAEAGVRPAASGVAGVG